MNLNIRKYYILNIYIIILLLLVVFHIFQFVTSLRAVIYWRLLEIKKIHIWVYKLANKVHWIKYIWEATLLTIICIYLHFLLISLYLKIYQMI